MRSLRVILIFALKLITVSSIPATPPDPLSVPQFRYKEHIDLQIRLDGRTSWDAALLALHELVALDQIHGSQSPKAWTVGTSVVRIVGQLPNQSPNFPIRWLIKGLAVAVHSYHRLQYFYQGFFEIAVDNVRQGVISFFLQERFDDGSISANNINETAEGTVEQSAPTLVITAPNEDVSSLEDAAGPVLLETTYSISNSTDSSFSNSERRIVVQALPGQATVPDFYDALAICYEYISELPILTIRTTASSANIGREGNLLGVLIGLVRNLPVDIPRLQYLDVVVALRHLQEQSHRDLRPMKATIYAVQGTKAIGLGALSI